MRLLFNREWYAAVSSKGQYETDFEDLIVARAEDLFPEYYVVPFEVIVESEEGRKKPDLALVDRRYRYWWVVEIEMAHHSLHSHVIPQVEVFSRGSYGQNHCDHMVAENSELDCGALVDMIKGAQPRVLVVVNQSVPNWIEPIRRLNGLVTIVEPFRSHRNRHILRINGDYPSGRDPDVVSACRLDNVMLGLLKVDSPAALGVAHGESVSIRLNGRLTDWERLDSSDNVWLMPTERNPLDANQDYIIMKDHDNTLSFSEV